MKKNEEYIVTCIDENRMGSGIVKIENQVVFVPDLLKDEVCKIKIVKVKKNYAFGIILDLIQPSNYRIKPLCPYKTCGGCQYMNVDYVYQIEMKSRQMKELFHRNVKEEIQVLHTIESINPLYYRNKAQFPVQVKDGQILMGFYRKHSNDIVSCNECKIQSKEINNIYQWLQSHISIQQAKELRHIFIRASKNESQVVFIGRDDSKFQKLSNQLMDTFPKVTSILFNFNNRKDNVILGEEYKILSGRDFIIEECMGNKIQLHFKSFFQVNPIQMEILYQKAIELANLKKDERCIDLYSGTGTIALAISKYVKHVTGVEIVKEAVDNANKNKELNHITNCDFICQDATEFAHEHKNDNIDVLFVDPPRKGMTKQGIEDIVTLKPNRIVYISCNPDSLCRDLNVFDQNGYECQIIQPVDMFCYTTGIENIALLVKQ